MKQQRWKNILWGNWPEGLSVVVTGLFLLQYVLWMQKEDGVWLTETVTVVKLTLLFTVLTELMGFLPWLLRQLLQLTFLFSVTGYMTGYVPVWRRPVELKDTVLLIQENFIQLEPFIWFALSAWLITLFAISMMKTKKLAITALVLTVIIFAVRDSFGTLDLRGEVGAVIFCGLLLIILCHAAVLKKSNPDGGPQISRYAPFITLPAAILLVLVVFLGMQAPNVQPMLTDPYTLWNNLQTNRSFLSAGGNSSIFSLGGGAVSGYGRDDSSLGGQLTLNQTPVMSVVSPQRSYWRGETRSRYTGEGWITSEVEREAALSPVSAKLPVASGRESDSSRLQTVEVTQTVTMAELGKEYPVLFGAYAIDRVRSITPDGPGVDLSPLQWSPRLSELRWAGSSQRIYPVSYTLTSKIPVVREEELRKLPAALPSTDGLEEYLAVPESLPARVRELALQVTASGQNLYDKVKRLEQYLATTFPYTTTPNLNAGQSKDFVDRFLFEIKEGYCDYFSTAMAVMLRSIDIPSRWVKGFAPGEATADGEYLVRNSDAHSWVEVYFPGYGWLPFEPTSGFSLPVNGVQANAAAEPVPEVSTEPEATSAPEQPVPAEPAAAAADPISRGSFLGGGAGAAAAAILLGFGWIFRRYIPLLRSIRPATGPLDTNRRVLLEMERFLRDARRKGYSRKDHETVREAVQRWGKEGNGAEPGDVEAILLLFEKAKYSDLPVTEEELTALTTRMQGIGERWKKGGGQAYVKA